MNRGNKVDSNNFNEYRRLFIDKLETLTKGQDELYAYIKDHMEREEENMRDIQTRLIKIEMDRLWTTKLWATGISAAGAIITFLVTSFKAQP